MTMRSRMGRLGLVWAMVLAVGASAMATELPHKKSSGKKTSSASRKVSSKSHAATPAKSSSGRAALPLRSADPYLGSIVVDAATGQVLAENNADAKGFPASVIKLMDMMVIMDRIAAGQLSLSNQVTVTAASSKIGGTQVWLEPREVFTIEELMYALMLQSANDAAMALAIGVAGSSEAFVELMNKKAAELGMTNTQFHSVHGLPPSSGKQGDTSTARDLSILARALLSQHPEITQYTSTRIRNFREGKEKGMVVMRNHNHLLNDFPGCDGLKTGYISAGGFSLVATAERNGRRVIAVVLGSRDRKVRDARAAALLGKGFAALPPPPPPPPMVAVTTNLPTAPLMTEETPAPVEESHVGWLKVAGIGIVVGLLGVIVAAIIRKRSPRNDF